MAYAQEPFDTKVIQAGARIFDASLASTNTIHLTQFVATRTMTVRQLGLYVASASAGDTWHAGIYNLARTSLLGRIATFAPTTAGFVLNNVITPFQLSAGTEYWFAWKGTNGSATTGLFNSVGLAYPMNRSLFDAGANLPASAAGATSSPSQIYGYISGR